MARLLEPGPPYLKRRYRVYVHDTRQLFHGLLDSVAIECVFPNEADVPPFRLRTLLTTQKIDTDIEALLDCLAEEGCNPHIDREWRWLVDDRINDRQIQRCMTVRQWDGEALPFSFQDLEA